MSHPNLDVLCLAAHPDDIELFAGGTVCSLLASGRRVGIIDLTRGELGTRGNADIRANEAALAANILGLTLRQNLQIPDGRITNSAENQEKIIRVLRKYRPRMVLAHSEGDRHPDHGDAARLTTSAIFASGLVKIQTSLDGEEQLPWRPSHVLQFVQNTLLQADLVVDVSAHWVKRIEALTAYRSQFWSDAADESEPETYISSADYFLSIEARARVFGRQIGVRYGEPFIYANGPIGVSDLWRVFSDDRKM